MEKSSYFNKKKIYSIHIVETDIDELNDKKIYDCDIVTSSFECLEGEYKKYLYKSKIKNIIDFAIKEYLHKQNITNI